MPYTREWTPTSVDLTNSPKITVRTWDGQPVSGLTYFVSGNALVITVPSANKYKITVRSGPYEESIQLNIPVVGENTLESRLRKYIEALIGSGGGSTTVGNIVPDPNPDYEGYFIVQPPEESA